MDATTCSGRPIYPIYKFVRHYRVADDGLLYIPPLLKRCVPTSTLGADRYPSQVSIRVRRKKEKRLVHSMMIDEIFTDEYEEYLQMSDRRVLIIFGGVMRSISGIEDS